MNLSPRWISFLQAHGFAALHWSDVGAGNAPDSELMTLALEESAIVLTHDLDFSAILAATGESKPSVVQIRAGDLSPQIIGQQVVAALQQLASELLSGALVTLDAQRTRVRLLPFGHAE